MGASNIVSTVDQTRQDFQFSTAVNGLLKNVYIDTLNNTTFHATPLTAMMGGMGGSLKFEGNKVIKAFKHQGAGGFGAISEGGNFVKGRNQKGFQGYERLKYLNAFFSLTGPAIATVMSGKGSYVDAVADAMDDTLLLSKMNMERMLGGAGTGEVARVTIPDAITETAMAVGEYVPLTGASSTTAAALSASSGGAYSKCQWLQPGIRVNAVIDANFDSTMATDQFVLTNGSVRAVFEVGNVDYDAETFSLKNVSVAASTVNLETYDDDNWVLVLENAYGAIEDPEGSTIDQCLELNGLYNLIDDGDTYSKIWNLTRSTYPDSLKSTVKAAASAELDEDLLIGYMLDLVNIKHSMPNVLVTDPKSRLKYFGNRKEDRRFDTTVMSSDFGYQRIGVQIDNYNLEVMSVASLVPGTLFMLDTADFRYAKATEGFKWIDGGTGALRPYEGSDAQFATAVNYCNLVCENPKGQLKVTGLAY